MNHFLIAHKVCGEPAFDVAVQMTCPICDSHEGIAWADKLNCPECDNKGFWWIIPTSGHRAYPFWSKPIEPIPGYTDEFWLEGIGDEPGVARIIIPEMPPDLPDHYPHSASPQQIKAKLDDLLAELIPKVPTKPFKRR